MTDRSARTFSILRSRAYDFANSGPPGRVVPRRTSVGQGWVDFGAAKCLINGYFGNNFTVRQADMDFTTGGNSGYTTVN